MTFPLEYSWWWAEMIHDVLEGISQRKDATVQWKQIWITSNIKPEDDSRNCKVTWYDLPWSCQELCPFELQGDLHDLTYSLHVSHCNALSNTVDAYLIVNSWQLEQNVNQCTFDASSFSNTHKTRSLASGTMSGWKDRETIHFYLWRAAEIFYMALSDGLSTLTHSINCGFLRKFQKL